MIAACLLEKSNVAGGRFLLEFFIMLREEGALYSASHRFSLGTSAVFAKRGYNHARRLIFSLGPRRLWVGSCVNKASSQGQSRVFSMSSRPQTGCAMVGVAACSETMHMHYPAARLQQGRKGVGSLDQASSP